ncbi:FG-GAP-like repeat-containing protein, partial [Planctomycetota bacterium]
SPSTSPTWAVANAGGLITVAVQGERTLAVDSYKVNRSSLVLATTISTSPSRSKSAMVPSNTSGSRVPIERRANAVELPEFPNQGNEQFGAAQIAGDGLFRPLAVRMADLDGNGTEDLVASASTYIAWFQSRGNGQFVESKDVGLGFKDIRSFEIVDVNADGKSDIVVTSQDSVSWLENENWTATSSRPQPITDSQLPRWSSVGDVDSDGLVDVVVGLNDSLVWYRNQDEAERFSTAQVVDSHKVYTNGAVADVDGDGDLDIVVTERYRRVERLYWYRNVDGSFGERIPIEDSISVADEISLTDFDSDGDIDLLLKQPNARQVTWLEGLGDGEFGTPVRIATLGDEDVHFADLDHDGNQDLLFTNANTAHIRWHEQRIPGDSNNDGAFDSSDLVTVFTAAEYEDGIPNNSTFAEGDWNRDGDFDTADLVLAFRSGRYGKGVPSRAHNVAATIDLLFDTYEGRNRDQSKSSKLSISGGDEALHRNPFLP